MDDLPPPTKVSGEQSSSLQSKSDEPLFEAKINNPFSKFFNWLKSLIKSEGIKINIKPLTAIGIAIALTGGGGIIGGAIVYFFPNNSPLLHRAIIYQGNLQRTPSGFILTLPNSDLYTLRPKSNTSINFKSLSDGLALVKGNLTPEKFVIEVSEIIPLETQSAQTPTQTSTPKESGPTFEVSPSATTALPELFPDLQWEKTQKRVLIFTSGKRKIEQEGVYLESAQINSFPQDFINYYIQELKASNFKETLNSINPEGITITYAKDDLFLTFGTKNKYSGSGDKQKTLPAGRQVTGYIAFIEHN